MSRTNWLDRCVLAHPPLTLCLTEKAYLQAFKASYAGKDDPPPWVGPDVDGTTHTVFKGDEPMACIVCMKMDGGETLSQVMELLAHEAQHVVQKTQAQFPELPMHHPEMECRILDHVVLRLIESFLDQTGRVDRLPPRKPRERAPTGLQLSG